MSLIQVTFALGVGICLFAGGCNHVSGEPSSKMDALTIPVPAGAETITVEEQKWPNVVRTQGSLAADEQTTISSKVAGRVNDTLCEFGDVVEQGQILARLEFTDFELNVRRAEAQLAEACAAIGLDVGGSVEDVVAESVPMVAVEKAMWDEAIQAKNRSMKLRESNSISDSEFLKTEALERVANAKYQAAVRNVDQQKALIQTRRVQLSVAKQNMEDATVRAPFAGVIQQRRISAGAYVQAGTPMFTLVRVNPLRFRGRIPERKAAQIEVGQPISIQVEGHANEVLTKVKRVSPSLDLASRSLMIEADVPNDTGKFRSGLFAEGSVEVDSEAAAIAVPHSSVGEFAGIYKVWRIQDAEIVSTKISLGRSKSDLLEVSGVSNGDVLLLDFRLGDLARREAANAAKGKQASGAAH